METTLQTGLRLDELTWLRRGDMSYALESTSRRTGNVRKERCVPLTSANVAIPVHRVSRARGPGSGKVATLQKCRRPGCPSLQEKGNYIAECPRRLPPNFRPTRHLRA